MDIFALNLDEKSFAALAAKVGASPRGVGILVRKAGVRFFLVRGVRVAAANIIKQDALSVGADVAVAASVVFGGEATTDAVVFGTPAQLFALAKKCEAQDFGLARLGAGLREFLRENGAKNAGKIAAKNDKNANAAGEICANLGANFPNSNLDDLGAEFCGDLGGRSGDFGGILAQNGADFATNFSQNQTPADFAALFDVAWSRQIRAKPHIMGVVNVTADSFNPASRTDVGGLLARCESFVEQGADYIDVGVVSSRPGSAYCGADEEVRRVRAVVAALRGAAVLDAAKFSLDSYCAEALQIALDAGFAMVNDIAGSEAAMRVAGRYGAEYCLMHGWNGISGGTASAAEIAAARNGAASVGENFAPNSNLCADAARNGADFDEKNHSNSNLCADGRENSQDVLANAPNSNLGESRGENAGENFSKNCAQNRGENCAQNRAQNRAEPDIYGTKILREVAEFFARNLALCARHGVKKIVLDVGVGFGKTQPQNLALIKHLRHFAPFGLPLLVGASRKSVVDFYSKSEVCQRLAGTLFLHQKALENGASFVRVHDVFETRQMVEIMQAFGEI